MSITFGRDTLCKHCVNGHARNGLDFCPWCKGSGLSFGPQAPVRRTDPPTSVEAAASISSEAIRNSQALILLALRKFGDLTDEGIYAVEWVRREMSPSGARTRRAELVGKGLVEDSGRTEVLSSGRRATVWRAR